MASPARTWAAKLSPRAAWASTWTRQYLSEVLLPAMDFRVPDGQQRLLLHHFHGDGGWLGHEFGDDPNLGALRRRVRPAWHRGTPHEDFEV